MSPVGRHGPRWSLPPRSPSQSDTTTVGHIPSPSPAARRQPHRTAATPTAVVGLCWSVSPMSQSRCRSPVAPMQRSCGQRWRGRDHRESDQRVPEPRLPHQWSTFFFLASKAITPRRPFPLGCAHSIPPGLTSLPEGTESVTSTHHDQHSSVRSSTGAAAHPRGYPALWLPVPMLALVGLGAAVGGKRARKAWGLPGPCS